MLSAGNPPARILLHSLSSACSLMLSDAQMKLESFKGLITWKKRLVLILVKHSLAAARNEEAFVASAFPFKEKKPHFTVAHWNLFTSSLEGKMLQQKFTRNWCRCCRPVNWCRYCRPFFIFYLARVCHWACCFRAPNAARSLFASMSTWWQYYRWAHDDDIVRAPNAARSLFASMSTWWRYCRLVIRRRSCRRYVGAASRCPDSVPFPYSILYQNRRFKVLKSGPPKANPLQEWFNRRLGGIRWGYKVHGFSSRLYW